MIRYQPKDWTQLNLCLLQDKGMPLICSEKLVGLLDSQRCKITEVTEENQLYDIYWILLTATDKIINKVIKIESRRIRINDSITERIGLFENEDNLTVDNRLLNDTKLDINDKNNVTSNNTKMKTLVYVSNYDEIETRLLDDSEFEPVFTPSPRLVTSAFDIDCNLSEIDKIHWPEANIVRSENWRPPHVSQRTDKKIRKPRPSSSLCHNEEISITLGLSLLCIFIY